MTVEPRGCIEMGCADMQIGKIFFNQAGVEQALEIIGRRVAFGECAAS